MIQSVWKNSGRYMIQSCTYMIQNSGLKIALIIFFFSALDFYGALRSRTYDSSISKVHSFSLAYVRP